jgi:hypothetical protein
MGATTECALLYFGLFSLAGGCTRLTSQSVSLSLSRDPGITKELPVALRSREVRGGMGVWISLPEVCVRCSNCHAIVAGSGSEGALRVRGNESEAPSQQGKPGKRGRMRRKNPTKAVKIRRHTQRPHTPVAMKTGPDPLKISPDPLKIQPQIRRKFRQIG